MSGAGAALGERRGMPGRVGRWLAVAGLHAGVFVGLLVGLFAGLCTTAHARPNIVLIVADDIGYTDLGAFGGEIRTPHLDRLAARGARFSNFHASGSCSPSRAMLLTGVEHHRAGVGNLRETMPSEHAGKPGYGGSLKPGVVTLAQLLRDAGWRTQAVGKWNVGSEPHNLPPQRGFERSLVQGDTGSDNWDPQQRYLPHSARVEWFEDGRPATMPRSYYSSTYFVDKTIEYLKAGQASGKPFFAYLAFQANHVPLQAPAAFIERYRGRYDTGWAALRQARAASAAALGLVPPAAALAPVPAAPDWAALDAEARRYQARVMEVYAGMAEAMDLEIGRLMAYLESTGELAHTVFVFLSDNGPEGSDYRAARLWLATQYDRSLERLGGPGAYALPGPGWAGASASPLAGYKFFAGEGGLRVPLIVAGVPGQPAGALQAAFTQVVDVAPTLLALAGVAHPAQAGRASGLEPLTGRSLLPLLGGQADAVYRDDEPVGYELSGNAALFKGGFKLVRNGPPVGDGQWRLFDLRSDPGEARDLSAAQSQRAAAMRADYEAWARAHGVLPMPEGFDPQRQVARNTLRHYFFPHYGPWVAGGLLLLAAGWVWRRRRRAAGMR